MLSVVDAWLLPSAADWPVVAVLDEASLPEAVSAAEVVAPLDAVSLPEAAPPVVAASLPEAAPLVDAVLLLVEPAAPVDVDALPVVAALPSPEPVVWLLPAPAAWVAEEACSEPEAACVDVSLPEEACVVEVPVLLLPVEAPPPVAVEVPLSAVVEAPAPVVAEVPPLAAVELPLLAASEVALPACPVVAA